MTRKAVLQRAAKLADINVNAAKLLLELDRAESGEEIAMALDFYEKQSELISVN